MKERMIFFFQIGSTNPSNLMPATNGIRSYQVVNEGTDEQFVSRMICLRKKNDHHHHHLDSIWIYSIDTTNRDYMDIYCINRGISSTSLLLETALVSSMLLQTY